MMTLIKLTLVLTIILLTPMLCHKIHVPSLVGFILAGMLLGPNCVGWIQGGETIQMLGQLGLLYIMFQAGVEIDLNDFQQYRSKAFVFGLLTFIFPMLLGLLTSRLLGFGWATSLLLGAMYGSHTLMTYPIVSRYGIQKNAAVNITVGGTMLAITLSLLVLASVEHSLSEMDGNLLLNAVKLILFIVITVVAIPRFAQWFFKHRVDPAECFVMVMFLLVTSSLLAEIAGLDAILGAFMCGVVLNRLIPNLSPVMRRINFTGNTIFVPMFLLGVGTIIDVHVLVDSPHIYLVASVMILTKLLSKWLAAFATQQIFRLSSLERQLIFGLTHATAAGTLAVVTIGYQMGIFGIEILNGAVIMILILCTLSGFITEYAAKQLALQEEAHLESERTHDHWLMMSVGEELHDAIHELSTLSQLTETEIRQCTDWQEARKTTEQTATSIAIYHEVQPLNTISRLLVAIPRYAEKERDFISCFGQLRRLSSQIGARTIFYACDETQIVLRKLCNRPGKYLPAGYRELADWEDVLSIAKEIMPNDMLVIISARRSTASYNTLFEELPNLLTRFFSNQNYLLMYPEQGISNPAIESILMEGAQPSSSWNAVNWIKTTYLNYIRKHQRRKI